MRLLHAILALAATASAQRDTLASVKAAFENAGIVGDVIPAFNPRVLLTVSFPGTGTFTAGTLLTPARTRAVMCCWLTLRADFADTEASQRPTFSIPRAFGAGKTFLIAKVDPDAPTPQDPSVSQIRHFVAPDFRLGLRSTTLVNRTGALSDYVGPAPPAGSDPHRCVCECSERNIQTLMRGWTGTRSFCSSRRTRASLRRRTSTRGISPASTFSTLSTKSTQRERTG